MNTKEVDAFLAHHGVLGMHWGHHKGRVEVSVGNHRLSNDGVRKAGRSIVVKAESGARKTVGYAKAHPKTAVAAVIGARVLYVGGKAAYQHRGEIITTAVLAAHAAKWLWKNSRTPQSPEGQALALGRQIVQGFVIG